jgi:ATP-dependent 26S proteasome regulatory subunit
MFETAVKKPPAVLFIDELDAAAFLLSKPGTARIHRYWKPIVSGA